MDCWTRVRRISSSVRVSTVGSGELPSLEGGSPTKKESNPTATADTKNSFRIFTASTLSRRAGKVGEWRGSARVTNSVHVSVHVGKQKGCETAGSPFAPFPYFSPSLREKLPKPGVARYAPKAGAVWSQGRVDRSNPRLRKSKSIRWRTRSPGLSAGSDEPC